MDGQATFKINRDKGEEQQEVDKGELEVANMLRNEILSKTRVIENGDKDVKTRNREVDNMDTFVSDDKPSSNQQKTVSFEKMIIDISTKKRNNQDESLNNPSESVEVQNSSTEVKPKPKKIVKKVKKVKNKQEKPVDNTKVPKKSLHKSKKSKTKLEK